MRERLVAENMAQAGDAAESIAHVPVVRTTHKVAEGSVIVRLAKETVFTPRPQSQKTPPKWLSGQLLPAAKRQKASPSKPAGPLPS